MTDVFSVESDIAQTIAGQLRAKLIGQKEEVIVAKPTYNPEAYDAYLRGLAYTLKPGGVTLPEAIRKLDEILNIMPNDIEAAAQKAGVAQAEGDLPRAAALLAPLQPRGRRPSH